MTRQRAEEKVRKLLALALHPSADPEEARSARMNARKIAFKNGLEALFQQITGETDVTADTAALSPDQAAALRIVLQRIFARERLTTLAGPAGSGKTTLIRAVLAALEAEDCRVVCVSPTWKAALRMEAATGRSAGSIHGLIYAGGITDEDGRLVGFNEREEGSVLAAEQQEQEEEDWFAAFGRPLSHPESEPQEGPHRVVIIDEASMVGARLMDDAWAALAKGVQVLAVGDPYQLEPVGDRPAFDLVHADAKLTQIHRQAEGSVILRVATEIRTRHCNLTHQLLARHGCGMAQDYLSDLAAEVANWEQSRTDYAVLVATHRSRMAVNTAVRSALGFPPLEAGPALGERVIAMTGLRTLGLDLCNGDVGRVQAVRCGEPWRTKKEAAVANWQVDVRWDRGFRAEVRLPCADWLQLGGRDTVWVASQAHDRAWEEYREQLRGTSGGRLAEGEFERTQREDGRFWAAALAPAYAITIHKAQGSEYTNGMIVVEPWLARREGGWKRDYTALTRLKTYAKPVEIQPGIPLRLALA